METDLILKLLLEHGTIGVVAVLALVFALRKDKEATKAKDQLVEKVEAMSKAYHQLSKEMDETLRLAMGLFHAPRPRQIESSGRPDDGQGEAS